MIILGLLGPAGAGKSTAAKYLHRTFGAMRFSLADPLKSCAMATLGFTYEQCYGTQEQKETVDPRYGFSPRWFLQRLGTEGTRNVFGENFWTEMLLRQIDQVRPAVAVIEDVRFINEATEIRRRGGIIWRLETPDRQTAADGAHQSESEWMRAPHDRIVRAAVSPGARDLLDEIRRAVDATPALSRQFLCPA